MRVAAITLVNFRLMIRDRSNLVSMIVVPLLFVFLIGLQFGGESSPTVAVARTGAVADEVAERLAAGATVDVVRTSTAAEVHTAVGRGDAGLGVIVPDDAESVIASGAVLDVEVVSSSDDGSDLASVVGEAVNDVTMARVVAAHLAATDGAPPLDVIAPAVAAVDDATARIDVALHGDADADDRRGQFDEGASQQLALMVFMFTMFSAVPMAQTRVLGVTHRMAATPTSVSTIVAGEACGRWVVAIAQGTYIMVFSALLFGVSWGNVPAAALTLAVFGAVGAGAGMLLGAWLDDEGVLVGLGVVIALVLAAVGGSMLPTELMGDTLRSVSRFSPHSWAIDAFAELGRGGGVPDIVTQLGVMAAMAAVLLGLASWRLRAVLTRP